MAREGRQRPSSSLTSSFPLLSVAGCEELIPKNHEEREGSLVSPEPRVEREREGGDQLSRSKTQRGLKRSPLLSDSPEWYVSLCEQGERSFRWLM